MKKRNHQGCYLPLSKTQQHLLNELRDRGMSAGMLRKWEKHPHEKQKSETIQTYLSFVVSVPANFSSYHADAVKILMQKYDFDAATAVAELNHIKKQEAKAFVAFHQYGLTLKFIREHHEKYYFNETTIKMLKLLMNNDHMTLMNNEHMAFQHALDEIEGLESWLFEIVVDMYDDGLRCKDIRELIVSDETENVVRNACLEYFMHKDDPRWGNWAFSNYQFFHFVNNVFHGARKLGASPQDAWMLTAGQLQQISLGYHFTDNQFWNAPRSVQAEYLLAGYIQGIPPQNIPIFYARTLENIPVPACVSSFV